MIKKIIKRMKVLYNKRFNSIPDAIYISPEDLALLREELGLSFEETLERYSGLKIMVEPNIKLTIVNENNSGRHLLFSF